MLNHFPEKPDLIIFIIIVIFLTNPVPWASTTYLASYFSSLDVLKSRNSIS